MEANNKPFGIRQAGTGYILSRYKNRKTAQKKADRMNLEYGAHRYSVTVNPDLI